MMHIYLNLKVLQEEGFNLLGLATFILTFHQAEEFLDVYRCIGCLLYARIFTRGVVEEWGESVTHLSSGPCLALQVSRQNLK